jgi:RNA polymerase sigma-70 factor, ECF subfamily
MGHGGVQVTAVRDDFEGRADPFRRELLAHCYRMLGSVHEAEDLVQETMLRAWRSYDRYDDQRSSVRTWLYRIATNACLTKLSGASRRILPSGLGAPGDDPEQPLAAAMDIPWLQPMPDTMLGLTGDDPAVRASVRSGSRLAFVAAMQYLPARQRAILILRDVLEFSALEVADILATTPAAVNSGLQRARARLSDGSASEDEVEEPSDQATRSLIDQYVAAFESANVPALIQLLTDQVVMEMPPVPLWLVGPAHYGQFITRVFRMAGRHWRMLPTSANGQPAVGAYCRGEQGTYEAHTVQVFSLTPEGISRNVVFWDSHLFELFGLPPTLDGTSRA